jgi:ribosomal protein S7
MSTGLKYKKKVILPDVVYNDIIVAKFINQVMTNGKKTVAQKIVYDSFDIIKEQTKKDPLEVFKLAIQNVSPALEVKPKRVGGATYQVPMEVRGNRKLSLAMKWIIVSSRNKKRKTFYGLAGLGDLSTTCISPESRNRTLGERIAKGEKLEEIIKTTDSIIEGATTTEAVYELSKKYEVEMPIVEAAYNILYINLKPTDALKKIMERERKPE